MTRFTSLRMGLTLFAVIALALVLSIGVSAQDNPDPVAAAQWVPADAIMYGGMRTDDALIDGLDGILNDLIQQVYSALPPEMLAEADLSITTNPIRSALDDAASSEFGGAFDETIRPWLGNTAAIGISWPDMMSDPGIVAILELTDRDAAEAFILSNLVEGDFTESQSGDFTLYDGIDDFGDPLYLAINDEILIFASTPDMRMVDGGDSLADSPSFTTAMDNLPEDYYGLAAYIDYESFFQLTFAGAAGLDPSMEGMADLFKGIGGMAIGGTIQENRVFIADIAWDMGSSPLMGSLYGDIGAVNTDFLNAIPKDADFVIHGTNLSASYNNMIDMLRTMADNGMLEGMTSADLDAALGQIDFTVQFATGVTLSEGIMDWMTGDYAIFLSYDPPPVGEPSLITAIAMPEMPDEPIDLGIEIGIVFEATDPAAAGAVVDGIERAIELFAEGAIPIERGEVAGASALLIRQDLAPFQPMVFVIGSNDDVLVMGTRAAAEVALSGSGGLQKSPAYQAAQAYMLPDSMQVMYMDGPAMMTLTGDVIAALTLFGPIIGNIFNDVLEGLGSEPTQPVMPDPEELLAQVTPIQQAIRDIAGILESATITVSVNDGILVERFTLTLGE